MFRNSSIQLAIERPTRNPIDESRYMWRPSLWKTRPPSVVLKLAGHKREGSWEGVESADLHLREDLVNEEAIAQLHPSQIEPFRLPDGY
jgi:hypothetical protein